MLNINKVIVLENGEEYLVLDKVNYQDTDYYYIAKVNESETDIENDYKLVVVTEKDNNKVITEVTGEEKLKEILRKRRYAGKSTGWCQSQRGGRGVRSHRGHQRLRQVHPAPHAGGPGPAHFRLRHRGREEHLLPEG